jgi:PhzF family phenazine biosynthesis protein
MKHNQVIYQVDAFTAEPFKGNPAGVCILNREPGSDWMQNIAMEMNLSETAFVFKGQNGRGIRFFTPEAEMKLCGHATLSASHILFEAGFAASNESIRLQSKAGELIVKKEGEWICMNFPVYSLEKIELTPEFGRVTGANAVELYKADFGWILALLKTESEVRGLNPDFSLMKNSLFGELIATAESDDPGYDFCVRCFAPAVGINEDPVTGSAHCALAPFWSGKTGSNDFISHQVSKRGGELKVSLKGNRVEISGRAKTVFKAELFV